MRKIQKKPLSKSRQKCDGNAYEVVIVHEISSSLTRDFNSFADKSSAPALVRFSRPHTVFGTMVSWNSKIKKDISSAL